MDIDANVIDQVGDATYARWKDAALADLANIICQKALFQITDDYVGIIVGDGQHVALLAWYSEVTNVQTTDGVNLDFHVNYDMSDGWAPETKYANCITITERLTAGTAVTVTGTHGFAKLPAPLSSVLAAIIEADQNVLDQTDIITSKSIEDVSVGYATITETAMERALTPYQSLISQWSLCRNEIQTGSILSMPRKHHQLPWWLNAQDYMGGDYAYGNAL
jgi:hypothetical protein